MCNVAEGAGLDLKGVVRRGTIAVLQIEWGVDSTICGGCGDEGKRFMWIIY